MGKRYEAEGDDEKRYLVFRFEKLDVWQKAMEWIDTVYSATSGFPSEERFGLTSQLRRASISVAVNIAEGSGSDSDREFAQFINYAKRSAFENANMFASLSSLASLNRLIIFTRRKYVSNTTKDDLLVELDHLCRMMTNFRKSLRV